MHREEKKFKNGREILEEMEGHRTNGGEIAIHFFFLIDGKRFGISLYRITIKEIFVKYCILALCIQNKKLF